MHGLSRNVFTAHAPPIPAAALFKQITGAVITPSRNYTSVFVLQQHFFLFHAAL